METDQRLNPSDFCNVLATSGFAATAMLMDAERTNGFTMSLLTLTSSDTFDIRIRLLAATQFKNVVKRNWNVRAHAGGHGAHFL